MTTPTRRHFLELSAAGALLLSLTAAGLAPRAIAGEPPAEDLQALSPKAFRVLEAVAETVCPGSMPPFPSASQLDLARSVDAYLATLHPADVAELEQALMLLESGAAGLLLGGRPRRFTACSPRARARALARWRESRLTVLRKAYKALRSLCATTYYADRRVYSSVGYPGPPDFGQAAAPVIQPAQPAELWQ
jgi:hypothetical protein